MENVISKKFQKKDDLIDAAMAEFSTHTYQSASLNNILQKAGISKGAFYHHFSHKEDLYLFMVGQLLEKKKQFLSKNFTPDDLTGDIFHIIKRSIHFSLSFAKSDPYIIPFTNRLLKERGNPIFEMVMSKYTIDNDAYVRSLIQNAILSGNIRDDLSIDFVQRLVVHILGNVNDILNTESIEDYASKVDELLLFLEYGLKKKTKNGYGVKSRKTYF